MSQQPSGWYDDPSNPDMLRYWDGVSWTNHTAPRKSPTAGPVSSGGAAGGSVGVDRTGAAAATPTRPEPARQAGVPQAPQQYYQQAPANAQGMHDIRTTADGVQLASWGKRFGAWVVDGIILAIVGGFVSWFATPALSTRFAELVDAAEAGDQARLTAIQGDLAGPVLQFSIVLWLVTTAYCLIFWTTTGQTPGKRVLGISVRRADRPGPLPIGTAVLRRVVPLLGQFVPFLSLLDGLWPLWDDKRQAVHDKLAGTQVVEGKQPRHQA
jgi:uncharacterized RDD family membrane protein YckC